jgi:hypothetical protein
MKTIAEEFDHWIVKTHMPVNMATESCFYAGALSLLLLLAKAGEDVSPEIATLRVVDLKAQIDSYFQSPSYRTRHTP